MTDYLTFWPFLTEHLSASSDLVSALGGWSSILKLYVFLVLPHVQPVFVYYESTYNIPFLSFLMTLWLKFFFIMINFCGKSLAILCLECHEDGRHAWVKKNWGVFYCTALWKNKGKIDMKYDRCVVFIHRTFELRVFILCI